AIIVIRGFMTGFSTGFIIQTLGTKGMIFTLLTLVPKELIIIPALIALGVNGINFSLKIIKNRSIKNISKEGIKSNFAKYCFVTAFFSFFILAGVLIEAYILPVTIRMMSSIVPV
ncbi:MAG TPA: stage II sporulation protein M, partial [Clostridia bacterium]|nr:stage II sporulation protein M [Clostridia bacterium]